MSLYQISDLENLSGIKAHTIRIWEQRYKLITPDRTATNIRRYSDEQLRKLLNVSTLLNAGYKISKIAALKPSDLNQAILKLEEQPIVELALINEFVLAILALDQQAIEQKFNDTVERIGLYKTMLTIIYPVMQKLGLMWVVDELTPVQEHFASCIIKRKLNVAIDQLPPPIFNTTTTKSSFLLALPPGEWHDIGLLMADYLLKSQGHQTYYLGQNVPYENIAQVVKQLKIHTVLLFYITPRNLDEVANELTTLAKQCKKTKLLVSGNHLFTQSLRHLDAIHTISQPQDLLDYAQVL